MEIVRVGIAVFLKRQNKILLGKRMGAHGAETWALPGGHLEFGETPEVCAAREVLEETSLKITNIQRGPYTSDVFKEERKHYITIFMFANCPVGEARILEPKKCAAWRWCDYNNLPEPLFLPLATLRKQVMFSELLEEYV